MKLVHSDSLAKKFEKHLAKVIEETEIIFLYGKIFNYYSKRVSLNHQIKEVKI